jgi:hypothetical protein
MMDEAYRLVFRGEILDGQHPAVVKKRLIDALKLSDDQATKLFSGSAVVLKRDADSKTASRYQGMFKQAGARLRIVRVAQEGGPEDSAAASQPESSEASAAAMQVLPVGTDVLRSDERAEAAVATVDISHLDIQHGEPQAIGESVAAVAVTVPEFSVADLGADMVKHVEPVAVDIDPHFDLAEVGADIPTIPVDRTPVVDMARIRFDVAEVGADIGPPHEGPEPEAPDISHISLVAE